MVNVNVTNFRKNIFETLEHAIKYSEPIQITTKIGNAVIINEEDYNGLLETIYLTNNLEMKQTIIDGLNTKLEDCISEEDVEW